MRNRSVLMGAALLVAAAAWSTRGESQTLKQIVSDNTAYGTTAAEFLMVPASARGTALGGAFGALTTDVSAVYFNPAGLAQMDRGSAMASTMNYVADTRYSWGAVGFPFSGGSRAIGFSVATFGFSDQPVYTVEDPQGTSGEVYSVAETVLGVTYAQQFSDRFSAGLTVKFINDQLGTVTGRAAAVDFGTNFHANVGGRPIRLGFVVQNLGTTLRHTGSALDALVNRQPPLDQQQVAQEAAVATLKSKDWGLPVMFRVSMSYDLFATSASRFSLLGEFTQPNNSDPGFDFAGEYALHVGDAVQLAGRASYTSTPDKNLDPAGPTDPSYAGFGSGLSRGAEGFAYGGGIRFGRARGFGVGFDYAYRNMGFLGSVNMMSVGLNW